MEASPFHHDHHSFLLGKSLLYPNPITPVVTSINSSDEFHQPHDHIIPYGSTDVSCYSNQAGICQNLQSSDSPMPMVVHGHIYDKTMPSTDSYVMTNKTCKSSRSQNKSNIGQENNNKKMKDSKEGQNGYVYVRARRGEATDNHSLAERVRREKISEKMKALQAIVPGCNKITGKALMLEEVINYVQFLQNEIQLLSSKLACVSPTMNDYEAEFDASKPLQNMITNQQQLLSFQEHQMSNMGFQSNGEVVWDLQEQRQELEDPFAIINNFINSF